MFDAWLSNCAAGYGPRSNRYPGVWARSTLVTKGSTTGKRSCPGLSVPYTKNLTYSPALQSQYKSASQQSSQHFHIAIFLRGRFQMFNERYEQLALSVGVYLLLVRPPTWAVRSPHIATQIAIMIFMHRYLTPTAAYKIRRPCRFVESARS